MSFNLLEGRLLSISDVVQNRKYDDQVVAVHGLFYIGSESVCRDYLLIPKKAFDGVDPGIVKIENRADVILIDEPALGPKLKQLPKACGSYIYKYDAVVVGSVRRRDGGGYGVALTDLWM